MEIVALSLSVAAGDKVVAPFKRSTRRVRRSRAEALIITRLYNIAVAR